MKHEKPEGNSVGFLVGGLRFDIEAFYWNPRILSFEPLRLRLFLVMFFDFFAQDNLFFDTNLTPKE